MISTLEERLESIYYDKDKYSVLKLVNFVLVSNKDDKIKENK
jgi:hypothetical protein